MTGSVPATMTAVEITRPGGGPDVLKPTRRPVPQPGNGEVLIKVAAAGVNRPDVLQRLGLYPMPPGVTDIPGLEVAGTIAALGPGADGFEVGDPVCALLAGGGYAEWAVAPVPQVLPVPKGLSPVEAAGLPETVFTVWTNVFERGALKPGESLLVHGGTSGIGTTAVQLAAALGSTVFATAGSDEKARACEGLGAKRGINYRTEDFVQVVKAETGGRGVDVVLDMVGGDYFPRNLECLAVEGRHVSIASLRGGKAEFPIPVVMAKRLTITGSTLRPRTVEQKGAIARAVRATVWPLIDAGRVRVPVHATFALAEADKAHALMESSTHIGKIILLAA
ncbi:MAG TPA: NAD(P)H-quinone oxidoreductase [Azospirillaceae bacterium]|nr:NAD(P)H-quinone oxidoreductase [Azospirillaceae bacterium]